MITTLPRGTLYLRSILSAAAAGSDGNPVAYARNTYGERVGVLTKAAVDAGGINSSDWGSVLATPEAQEFFAVVEQASILGKLAGLRRVPLNVRTQLISTGFSAHWVGGGKAKPLSKAALMGGTLTPLKVACLTAVTKELLRLSTPQSEARLRTDMVRAIAEALDAAFIDPANSGIANVMPASITNGVTPIHSSGNAATDIAALIAAFTGDYEAAAFVTDPITAAQIALARDAGGSFAFPDAGPRGGSILGLPLIVSRSSPRDSSTGQLALVDAGGIAYGAEGVRNALGEHSTLEMVDETTDPPAVEQVSMWQTNSVAILSEVSANWTVVRDGAVVTISDAVYATAVE
jgi:HK97 family phage major capsid protein